MGHRDYIPKTQAEIGRDFAMGVERLVRAGHAYDAGLHAEALSIAALVYLFVHDHGKSAVSLLSLARRKETVAFRDTGAPLNPRNLLTEHPLALAETAGGSEGRYVCYRPTLGQSEIFVGDKELRFSSWWEATVLRSSQRHEFSRKNLIFFFRNKMGGGHVSEGYDQLEKVASAAFAALARSDAGGWLVPSSRRMLRPEYGVQLATVRQIGWELEQTLRRHCGDLVAEAEALAVSRPRMISLNDRGSTG